MMREYVRDTFEHNGCTVRIVADPDAPNPYFDMDGMDHLLTWHSRSTFSPDEWGDWGLSWYQGRVWSLDEDGYEDEALYPGEIADHLQRAFGAVVVPVYLYEHSGMTVRTTPFGDRWDSGQLGYAFMTADEIRNEFGDDTPEVRDKVRDRLVSNIEVLDMYLRGDIWGYEVTFPDGREETCWGMYGFDYCRAEAMEIAV